MGSGLFFPISAIPFSILIMILFFRKGHVDNFETKIYKNLIIVNFFGLIIEMSCTSASVIYNDFPILSDFIYKLYLIYLIGWAGLFTLYIQKISTKKDMWDFKSKKRIMMLLAMLIALIVFVLPINLVVGDTFQTRYTAGPSVNFTYVIIGVMLIYILFIMIVNRKHIFSKKYIPVFVFFVVGTVATVIQKVRPELLLITYVETLICVVMYFTIENPDVKMLNELYRNKELTEQNYEEKYNFLFEITQESKNPLSKINAICSEILNENDKDKVKLGVQVISNYARQLDFSINNVLNISTLDIQKIRLVNSKYNISNLCNDLVLKARHSLKEGVELREIIPDNTPTLYGDYMKLKQIVYSLLDNAAKNTDNGFIEFKVNLIEKYDICRVIFNISDSGKGMPIDKINDILSATGELDKQELENLEKSQFNIKLCQKVVKIMGGNLMIKSQMRKGTEVMLTIDQRVYHDKDNSVLDQYENIINNYKKVLIVSQNERLVRKIKRICNENKITYNSFLYGGDAVDRIKSGKKYDYILISDEMKEMSGLDTCTEIKKIKNFRTPIIVMLNEDKENIKSHYLDDGFDDILLTSDFDNEIVRIVEKY